MQDFDQVEILLIEDNPNDGELTLLAFKKNKISNRIYVVANGEKALDFIFCRDEFADRQNCKHPKLIILDLKLPQINGLEVLEELKKNDITKRIPVVVLTSSKEERDLITTYKLGVNSYIVKPMDFEQFSDTIREIGLYWLSLNQVPSGEIPRGE
jgi:two-component system, response regulator